MGQDSARIMHVGHVDRITRQDVAGWAADADHPDHVVDVSIFVNGDKVAQISCDQQRDDLRRDGKYGAGCHGFVHSFAAPLSDDIDATVAVRVVPSGEHLGMGCGIIRRGQTSAEILAPAQPTFRAPAPTDPGSLFRLFSLYDAGQGLYQFLYRLDFDGARPHHLEYAALGEADPIGHLAVEWNDEVARDRLASLLHEPAFQEKILAHALRALPDKRRLLFVHIPKCAGTDLTAHLTTRFPRLEQSWTRENWTRKVQLFQALSVFAREVPFSDSIFVSGHVRLDEYIGANLVRPTDEVFTVVRAPLDIAVSQINYVITRLQAAVERGRMDTDVAEWMRMLGVPALPPAITSSFVNEIAQKALRHPDITTANTLCRWLGGGTADAVVERLARFHVEITDTERYNVWLMQRWGIAARTRHNESTKYVSLSALGHQDLAYLRGLSPQDEKLFDIIEERLVASGRPSVTGEELR
jgi:hypothetical protein